MAEIDKLLTRHGELEWVRYFSEPLKEVKQISSDRLKKKYLKQVAKNIPTGFGGVTEKYFQEGGRVLIEDSDKLHANLRTFFKLLNVF